MRLLTIMVLLFSFSALAQSRVKENIKQQAVAVSEDGSSAAIKKPVMVSKPVKIK